MNSAPLETEYIALVWHPMPHWGGPLPPATICLFTDGVCIYWTGWYAPGDGAIAVQTAETDRASHRLPMLPCQAVKYWAALPNFIAATTYDEHLGE
jgi:hypothetical protein